MYSHQKTIKTLEQVIEEAKKDKIKINLTDRMLTGINSCGVPTEGNITITLSEPENPRHL